MEIMMKVLLVLLCLLSTLVYGFGCEYGGVTYGCGAWIPNPGQQCCCCGYNDRWITCDYGRCTCPQCVYELDLTNDEQIMYQYTNDGILYSNRVRIAHQIIGDNDVVEYVPGSVIASDMIKLGSTVFHPIGENKHIVLPVEHYNVTDTRNNCCWAITLGTTCTYKYCCGVGCCC